MEILYVTDESYKIQKSSDTIVVKKSNKKMASIPLVHLKCVVLFGCVQLSTQVMHQLMQLGVNILYFDYKGDVLGIVISKQSNNVLLRIAQHKLRTDESYRLEFSKAIVSAKVFNQLKVYEAMLKKRHSFKDDLHSVISLLRVQLNAINNTDSIQATMGIEGICAKSYFSIWDKRLDHFKFSGRQRRPAKEPVNALLNYAYAFLRNEMVMRLASYGFDVELGFMHGVRYGRDSLALDLMESFRPIFADEFVIHLLNKRILTNDHFKTDEEACVLTPEGVGIFCSNYELWMHKPGVNGSYFQKLDREIKRFRSNVLSSKIFHPYRERER